MKKALYVYVGLQGKLGRAIGITRAFTAEQFQALVLVNDSNPAPGLSTITQAYSLPTQRP